MLRKEFDLSFICMVLLFQLTVKCLLAGLDLNFKTCSLGLDVIFQCMFKKVKLFYEGLKNY